MSAEVRPIYLLCARVHEHVRQRALQSLSEWAREWVTDGEQLRAKARDLRVEGASESCAACHEYEAMRTDIGRMWVRRTTADLATSAKLVVGSRLMPRSVCADDWITSVTNDSWEARNRALCTALLGTPHDPRPGPPDRLPEELFTFGSGAVELSWDSLGLHAVVDNAVWGSIPPRERAAIELPALVALDRAAASCRVRLEVMLGAVEIGLPQVLDLRAGDVLRLPQRLDEPVTLLCEGKPLARAVPGDAHGRLGVRVAADRR
jgi:flagellar motor switch protein FliM/N